MQPGLTRSTTSTRVTARTPMEAWSSHPRASKKSRQCRQNGTPSPHQRRLHAHIAQMTEASCLLRLHSLATTRLSLPRTATGRTSHRTTQTVGEQPWTRRLCQVQPTNAARGTTTSAMVRRPRMTPPLALPMQTRRGQDMGAKCVGGSSASIPSSTTLVSHCPWRPLSRRRR